MPGTWTHSCCLVALVPLSPPGQRGSSRQCHPVPAPLPGGQIPLTASAPLSSWQSTFGYTKQCNMHWGRPARGQWALASSLVLPQMQVCCGGRRSKKLFRPSRLSTPCNSTKSETDLSWHKHCLGRNRNWTESQNFLFCEKCSWSESSGSESECFCWVDRRELSQMERIFICSVLKALLIFGNVSSSIGTGLQWAF